MIYYIVASQLEDFSLNNTAINSAVRSYNYNKAGHDSVIICTTETAQILVLIYRYAARISDHRAYDHSKTGEQLSSSRSDLEQELLLLWTGVAGQPGSQAEQSGEKTQGRTC